VVSHYRRHLSLVITLIKPEQNLHQQNLELTAEGVRSQDRYIRWVEVSEIYLGGRRESVNFMPSRETRSITLMAKTGQQINITINVTGRLSGTALTAFSRLHQKIIDQTADRHWQDLIREYNTGQSIGFRRLYLRRDGIFFSDYLAGKTPLPFSRVKGYEIKQGKLYLAYLTDRGLLRTTKIADVSNFPNIHLFSTFMDYILSKTRNP